MPLPIEAWLPKNSRSMFSQDQLNTLSSSAVIGYLELVLGVTKLSFTLMRKEDEKCHLSGSIAA
tara:strand:- start:366 stop:557 length:192 start_codon:yes stop_codon:yes gene_type:complete